MSSNLIESNNNDTVVNSKSSRSYDNTYLEGFAIELNENVNGRESVFFWPDEPITIKIIGYEEEPSLVLLHTNIYIINITHCNHTWTIKRKYKNFIKLYEAYTLFKTKLNIRNVAASAHLTSTNYISLSAAAATSCTYTSATRPSSLGNIDTPVLNNDTNPVSPNTQHKISNGLTSPVVHCKQAKNKFKPADHFKLIFKTIASDFNQAKIILEKFLQDVVDHKSFRYHNEMLKFLEISHLSFINDLGKKNKEGLIKKRSLNIGCFSCASFNFFWDTRWLIIKDTWIAHLSPKTGRISCVLLVDHGFKVLSGIKRTGVQHGLYIENLSKSLLIKCYNDKRAQEWYLIILQMLYTTSKKFVNEQRFNSFAPIRQDSLTKWFVDGADYMETIADALEAATQEIFITGFFLTPEIYLKRPPISGDRWRLDKILKRKAEQGIKIYILIYKEIEITLPFNSAYAKRVFALSHKNIKVLRHPDHINEPNQFFTIMWAHHEKLVIVDQSVAFFGGIDLCYGRWDNHMHKLTDLGSVFYKRPDAQQQQQQLKQQNQTLISIENETSKMEKSQLFQERIKYLNHRSMLDSTSSAGTAAAQNDENNNFSEIRDKNNTKEIILDLTGPTAASSSSSTGAGTAANKPNSVNSDGFAIEDDSETADKIDLKLKMPKIRKASSPPHRYQRGTSPNFVNSSVNLLHLSCSDGYINEQNNSNKRKKSHNLDMASHHEGNTIPSDPTTSNLDARYSFLVKEYNDENDVFYTADYENRKTKSSNNNNSLRHSKSLNNIFNNDFNSNLSILNEMDASEKIRFYNRFLSIRDDLEHDKSMGQSSKPLANANNSISTVDNNESPFIKKIKQIKKLKENFKNFKLKIQQKKPSRKTDQEDSELNSSCDQEVVNKSFSVSSTDQIPNFSNSNPNNVVLQGSAKYWIGKDYCNFIIKDVTDVHVPFEDAIDRTNTPRQPWHDIGGCVCGAAARDIARHFIQRWNYVKTKKVKNNRCYPLLLPKAYQNFQIPSSILKDFSICNVQVLRSVTNWSAGISKTEKSIYEAMKHLIRTSKHYIYIENQFFISSIEENSVIRNDIVKCLFERIVKAHDDKENFKVYVFLPLMPGYEGEYGKVSNVTLHSITNFNNSSINGLIKKLADASIEALNYICFFGLRTWGELNNRLVTELIYVHSKLMIVDDRACIIGSANINDRSLLGNRDSELALLVEDSQFVDGCLNKKPCQVGLFSSKLRQRLFKEFLGQLPDDPNDFCASNYLHRVPTATASQIATIEVTNTSTATPAFNTPPKPIKIIDVSDPCSDEFYKNVMIRYAAQNTRIYDLVFRVLPCDYVRNFEELKEYQKFPCLNQTDQARARAQLLKIKGYVVLYPSRFLYCEDLSPPFGTKEKLLPTVLWT